MTRILGIDPGSVRTGVGIVDADSTGRCVHVHHEALHVGLEDEFPKRLRGILDGLWGLIDRFAPAEVAIERVFLSRNPDSALKLGQARGAAICAVVARDIGVHEYSPMQIKGAVVGRGAADKTQVQHMVGVPLGTYPNLHPDAAPALPVANTHAEHLALAARTGVAASQLIRRRGSRR